MQKKGLSGVVTAVLIILVVIAAVFILWRSVKGTFKEGAEQIDLELMLTNFKIDKVYADTANDRLQFSLTRGVDKTKLSAIIILVEGENDTGEKTQKTYNITDKIPNSGEMQSYTLNISSFSKVSKISIYPFSEKGKRGVEEKYDVKGTEPSSPPGGWVEPPRSPGGGSGGGGTPCSPSCAGKTCGDSDGCTGSCTNCLSGKICNLQTKICDNCDTCTSLVKQCGNWQGNCGSLDCETCSSGNCVDGTCVLSATEITTCQTINQAGTYILTSSITNNDLTDNCINITAENITLDCQGNFILSDDNYAGVYSNQINTTIQNCNITMGSIGGGGVYFEGANQSYIYNNNLSGQYYGILLSETNETTIELNDANSNSYSGIVLDSNSNNDNLISNTANLNTNHGILLVSSSNNILTSNTLNSNSNQGILLVSSSNNILTSNTACLNKIRDLFCSSSSSNSGSGNIFKNVVPCSDNNWPTSSDYTLCS